MFSEARERELLAPDWRARPGVEHIFACRRRRIRDRFGAPGGGEG